jgi:hypothetical protein
MPEGDRRLRLDDIRVEIEKIGRYMAGMSEADFQADDRTMDAVLRNFEVIAPFKHMHIIGTCKRSKGLIGSPFQWKIPSRAKAPHLNDLFHCCAGGGDQP